MAYCGPRGVPYLDFLGWDEVSRAAALAWAERDADRCPGCGLHHADIGDADRPSRLPVKGEYRRCVGCQAKEMTAPPEGEGRSWFHFRWRPRKPAASGAGG